MPPSELPELVVADAADLRARLAEHCASCLGVFARATPAERAAASRDTPVPSRDDAATDGQGVPMSKRLSVLSAVAVTALVLLLLALGLPRLLPSLPDPFGTATVDRSAPALLTRLSDLARFQAATGTYQVLVDVENDVDNVPSVLAGERALFLAQGHVDSYVDFGGLGEGAVTVSGDGKRVDVVLPPAALSDPRVDPEQSRVVSRQRGVLDRLGGVFSDSPTSERELYLAAQREMTEAAGAGELQERAEGNTRSMLTGLLGTLGFTDVRIEFAPDVRP